MFQRVTGSLRFLHITQINSLLNEQSDHGQRCQEEEGGHKRCCLLGSVTQVSRAAFHPVVISSVAHVASHAVFADQIVYSCDRQTETDGVRFKQGHRLTLISFKRHLIDRIWQFTFVSQRSLKDDDISLYQCAFGCVCRACGILCRHYSPRV